MESLRIKNLRCFEDTEEIQLNKLNIFLGTNSSGKSSILRTFPLMKQSIEKKTSEPILWYGDYVDFGNFENSLHDKDNEEISFEYGFDYYTITQNMNRMPYVRYSNKLRNPYIDKNLKVYFTITVNSNQITSMSIKINEFESLFILSKKDISLKEEFKRIRYSSKINPKLKSLEKWTINGKEVKFKEANSFIEFEGTEIFSAPELYHNVIQKMHNILSDTDMKDYIFESEILTKLLNYIRWDQLTNIDSSIKSFLKDSEIKLSDQNRIRLKKYITLYLTVQIINTICYIMKKEFTNLDYIYPLRANAQRYYRRSGISIDQIDPEGINVPLFLDKFDEKTSYAFENWTKKKFGIEFKIRPNNDYLSVMIKEGNNEINLIDSGFGYSQILPILLILWNAKNDKNKILNGRRSIKTIFAMEQPELHLHPAMQSKMLKTMVDLLKESKNSPHNIKFILETHSENIINSLSYMIKANYLDPEWVNIYIFEKEDSKSTPKKVEFTKDGMLNKRWPIGFFLPEWDYLC
ncbi:putative ATPase [Methanococcus voltae]|uniref:AAA family ATPase n=1 Tax=Methanococcus voltae TaxID=2188 RepID=UPI001AE20340|nr:putative ATPase [Methanococcus voltae]